MRPARRLAGWLIAPITPGAARAVVTLFVLTLALAAVNMLFTVHEVQNANRQWCDALALLTSKPVPRPADPAANPSRAQAYTLYAEFLVLRHRLGCLP